MSGDLTMQLYLCAFTNGRMACQAGAGKKRDRSACHDRFRRS